MGFRLPNTLTLALLRAVLVVGALLLFLAVQPARASAESVSYYCQDHQNSWCGEPGPSYHWEEGQAEPVYIAAYMCIGIEGVGATGFWYQWCSASKIAAKTAWTKYWGSEFWADGPFWGYTLMNTGLSYVESQTTWSWFWGP